jgi:hypothetical protein
MLGITMTASGFSGAANVLASPISPQWATGGTARRVVLKSYAFVSNGARMVRCRSNREVCMSGHTSVFWGYLPITRPYESRGRVMLESTNHASIVSICGGNAEIDLLASVGGQFVDNGMVGKPSRG